MDCLTPQKSEGGDRSYYSSASISGALFTYRYFNNSLVGKLVVNGHGAACLDYLKESALPQTGMPFVAGPDGDFPRRAGITSGDRLRRPTKRGQRDSNILRYL